MAEKGTRNTSIAFGDFTISVSMKKASFSRDVKTEIVSRATKQKRSDGNRAGTRRGPGDDEMRAVRISDERVLELPEGDLLEIEQRSKDNYATMQVLETIDYRQVPTERIVGAYWLQPKDGTAKGLRLLAEGLRATGRVAVVKWVSTSREKLGVIRVRGERGSMALLLSELTFANDFLAPDEDALALNDVPAPSERELAAAARLVKSFGRHDGNVTIDTASDEAVDARLELVQQLHDAELERAMSASSQEEIVVKASPETPSK